jgi:hypothetical protein
VLEAIVAELGVPQAIRCDNGIGGKITTSNAHIVL